MIAVGNLKKHSSYLNLSHFFDDHYFFLCLAGSRNHCPVPRYFFSGTLPEKPLILALKKRWLSVRQSI